MVRYVENCGRGRVPAVAVTYEGRRRLLSLLCRRSERRRFIPIPDIRWLGVGQSVWSADHVCYPRYYGHFQVGLGVFHGAVTHEVLKLLEKTPHSGWLQPSGDLPLPSTWRRRYLRKGQNRPRPTHSENA